MTPAEIALEQNERLAATLQRSTELVKMLNARLEALANYRVVIADWALGADGRAGDTLALEHIKADGSLCLVGSTTLDMRLSDLFEDQRRHEESCDATA